MEQCDIDSDRVLYFDISGRLFMATKTHPQPYEMQIKDIFTRSFIRRYIDTLQGQRRKSLPFTHLIVARELTQSQTVTMKTLRPAPIKNPAQGQEVVATAHTLVPRGQNEERSRRRPCF